jgi:hypothetical protein
VPLQPEQAEIPTDAHRSRPELLQVLFTDAILVGDVLDRQLRFFSFRRQPHAVNQRANRSGVVIASHKSSTVVS